MLRKFNILLLTIFVVSLGVSGCGKKAPPKAPTEVENTNDTGGTGTSY